MNCELNELIYPLQFCKPTTSWRRIVVHHVGVSIKSEVNVDMAGSTYNGTYNYSTKHYSTLYISKNTIKLI